MWQRISGVWHIYTLLDVRHVVVQLVSTNGKVKSTSIRIRCVTTLQRKIAEHGIIARDAWVWRAKIGDKRR